MSESDGFTVVRSRRAKRQSRQPPRQSRQPPRPRGNTRGGTRVNTCNTRGMRGTRDTVPVFIELSADDVAAVRETCVSHNVRGLAGWKGGDGHGHAKCALQQLVDGRLAELAVGRMIGSMPDFARDDHAQCDLTANNNRVEVKSTTLRAGETPRQAASRRGFTFQSHRMRGGKRVLVNPLFDPAHPHHARACAERVYGVVVEWRGDHVRVHTTSIWNQAAGTLPFKEMRRHDLRPFKKAVYG